jgi:multidrug efflux system membrane fusion protein
MPNPTLFRVSLILPVFSLLALLEGGCEKAQQAAPPPAFGVPVTAIPAVTGNVPVYLDEIGKTTASQSVTIVPQVSGVIVARHFVDGAELKKGQPLFDIDPRPYQAALDQAVGQRKKDEAQRISADWNVKSDQSAMEVKAISEQQLHNDIGTRDQAVGAIAVDDAQIENAKLNLGYCHITSPIDGRAGLRLVDVGNVVVNAGQAPGTNLLSIQTLDPIYADFTITEGQLLKVQQYMKEGALKVQVELPADVIAMAGPQPATQPTNLPPGSDFTQKEEHAAMIGTPLPQQVGSPATMPMTLATTGSVAPLPIPRVGTLTFLDNAVQDGSGTVKLRATIPNGDNHFWPGQFVNVRLILKVQKDAVLVPSQAVQISQAGPFVYVVDEKGSAQVHPVIQGQRQGDMVVIESGVAPGDSVVVTGQTMLQPGGKVMVVNAPHPGGPGGPPAGKTASNNSASAGEGKAS